MREFAGVPPDWEISKVEYDLKGPLFILAWCIFPVFFGLASVIFGKFYDFAGIMLIFSISTSLLVCVLVLGNNAMIGKEFRLVSFGILGFVGVFGSFVSFGNMLELIGIFDANWLLVLGLTLTQILYLYYFVECLKRPIYSARVEWDPKSLIYADSAHWVMKSHKFSIRNLGFRRGGLKRTLSGTSVDGVHFLEVQFLIQDDEYDISSLALSGFRTSREEE